MSEKYTPVFTGTDKEYINQFYDDAAGYAKVMCGNNRKGKFVPAKVLAGDNALDYMFGYHVNEKNTMMSMSTFASKGKATLDNIVNVCCLAIDVDHTFTDKKGNLLEAREVWKRFAMDCVENECFFPSPAYIEYGHRLRLVYVLSEPVCLNIADRKKRNGTIKWLMKIEQGICDFMNKLDARYNATPQQLTKFVRVPESLNIRYCGNKKDGFHVESMHIVDVDELCNGQLYEIHELAEWVLPELGDWYDPDYKEKEKKISVTKTNRGLKNMLKDRMDFLKNLQKAGWDKGYREVMCFLTGNFAYQSGMDEDEMEKTVRDFNAGFFTPMSEKEVKRSYPRKSYKYSDKHLCAVLGLSMEDAAQFGFKAGMSKKEYDREYSRLYRLRMKCLAIKAGKTKRQRMEKLIVKVKKMRENGLCLREIAKKIKMSIATASRYASAAAAH